MLEVRATTRFKKEVKKAARQQQDMQKLGDVIDLLQAEEESKGHPEVVSLALGVSSRALARHALWRKRAKPWWSAGQDGVYRCV